MDILDPVHGHIHIYEVEKPLIESSFIQRLRNIKQLTAADILYPGAVHTRFNHSIGAMYIGSKYANILFPKDSHMKQLIRLCMLFHDCGHVVGSHAYDDAVYSKIYENCRKGHDMHRFKIIQHPEIKDNIEKTGVKVEEIMDVWSGKNVLLSEVCQGQLGADRLDFTMRDSYFCGTGHLGKICLDRIINNCSIYKIDGVDRLHYSLKVKTDLLSMLTSRLNMYMNVYHHKTCNAAQIIYRKMLEHSMEPLKLVERTKDLEKFKLLTDYVIGEIMMDGREELKEGRLYAEKLLKRELPKMIWEKVVEHTSDNHEVIKKEMNEYIIENNIENYILDEIVDIKYIDAENINLIDKDSRSCNLLELSKKGEYEYYRLLRNYSIYRIYVL